jgi:hypothetical protein
MLRLLLSLAVLGALAGCSVGNGGDITLKIPIAGGGLAAIMFSNGSPVPAEDTRIRIEKSIFAQEGKSLTGRYVFGRYEKTGDVPRRITIDDVTETDEKPVNWVDDNHPQLKDGHWESRGRLIGFDDSAVRWMLELDPSIRIYRVTIVNGDGSTDVIYDAALYPAVLKEYFKKQVDDAAAPPPKPAQD